MYDLRKGDLFVLSWARVQQVRRGSISTELLMCGGGVLSIVLLSLVSKHILFSSWLQTHSPSLILYPLIYCS